MTALLELTVYFTIWTLVSVVLGAAIRNQEWTKEGRDIGLGNRDNLQEATPMGGRAERAAKNSIEAAVFFVPLALIANAAGLDAEVMLGAEGKSLSGRRRCAFAWGDCAAYRATCHAFISRALNICEAGKSWSGLSAAADIHMSGWTSGVGYGRDDGVCMRDLDSGHPLRQRRKASGKRF